MTTIAINVSERLEALMARRELRNPGLAKVRQRNVKTMKWDDLFMTPVRRLKTRG